ncbi:MAG TPA: septal ring lytic transglycosylase RlpA family protein [Polyangiales bacterium]|jgi:rare lipoprotein A
MAIKLGHVCLLMSLTAACESSAPSPGPSTPSQPAPVPARAAFDPRPYYTKRALAVRRGEASFYADSFSGRRTANGETYDPDAYTAAHRTFPFGTVLRVTRERTGAWVLVRVNDRGPYGPRSRVIDLSRVAAKRLAMLGDGVVKVRVEILEWGRR